MRKTDMLAQPNPKENEVRNMVWTLPTLPKLNKTTYVFYGSMVNYNILLSNSFIDHNTASLQICNTPSNFEPNFDYKFD